MSRKDFIVLANVIASLPADRVLTLEQIKRLAEQIADHCATTNPQFNRGKFLAACHV